MSKDNVEKLKMQSMDKVQANIERIRTLFPNAVTEARGGGRKGYACCGF